VVNPFSPDAPPEIRDVQATARANGLQLSLLNASTAAELDAAFTALETRRPDALLVREQVRTGPQRRDRKNAPPYRAADAARSRRRGDRVACSLLRLLTTGYGTKRTCQRSLRFVCFRGEVDMSGRIVPIISAAHDPNATLAGSKFRSASKPGCERGFPCRCDPFGSVPDEMRAIRRQLPHSWHSSPEFRD